MTARDPLTPMEGVRDHLNLSDNEGFGPLVGMTRAAEAYVSRFLPVPLHEMECVPDDLAHAVLMLVGHWYENREATLVGVSAENVPFGVREIIDAHRVWSF